MERNQKGITLIALVITIIVLLILAGVSIAMLTGDSGILTNAVKAKAQTELGTAKDQVALAATEALISYYDDTYVKAATGSYDATAVRSLVVSTINDLTVVNTVTKSDISEEDGTFTLTCNGWTVTGTIAESGTLSWGPFTK